MNKIIIKLGLFFLISLSPTFGKTDLTLEKAVELGLDNNYYLKASRQAAISSGSDYKAVRTGILPSLRFSASYFKLSEVDPFSIPAFVPGMEPVEVFPSITSSYSFKFTLQQPVFTGFRVLNTIKAYKNLHEKTRKDLEIDKRDLVLRIKSLYWQVYRLDRLHKLSLKNAGRIEAHLKDAGNLFEQGLITKNEILRVSLRLSNANYSVIETENNYRKLKLRLKSLIGIQDDEDFVLIDTIRYEILSPEPEDALVQAGLKQRLEVKSMEKRIQAAKARLKVEQAGWLPQIYLNANYYYSRPNQRIIPQKDEFKDTWDIGLVASFDIWNWGKTYHSVRKSKADLARVNELFNNLREQIELDVRESYLNLRQAGLLIQVSETAVEQARENYRMCRDQFANGTLLNSELLDAETELLKAETDHSNSRVNYETAKLEFMKAIGKEL